MSLIPYALTRPFLFGMDPESAHDLTMNLMAKGQNTLLQQAWAQPMVSDPVELAGLRFPNRVGMAAGLDKNARCIDALAAIGRKEEAREKFEWMLSKRNHLGMLSEDMDFKTHELWGNFPQTYSMVGLINSAMRLSKEWHEAI